MELLRPFELHLPDATLDEVHRRIRTFPWHEMPSDGGWEYGANLEYMKALCAYWLDGFDWRAQEDVADARLNSARTKCWG